MGRKLQYVTIDRVISKVYRDLGLEEVSETDLVEWTGEALEFIGAVSLYEEATAFIEVENHQAILPNGLHDIIQVARNTSWVKEKKDFCPANVILDCTLEQVETSSNNPCGCSTISQYPEGMPIPLDCNGTPIFDYEMAYYRPYFDLQYEYHGWSKSNLYCNNFVPVRLANHSFFNNIVCPEDPEIYCDCCNINDEYTIAGDRLKLSFKEGSIALSYHRQKVDATTGYPMIPDSISVTSAVVSYITLKYMARLWYMGREGYGDKMTKAEQDWQWYCKQASNAQMMLYGIDEHQNYTESKNQLIPRNNKYYGFFGKLGKAEYTGFKNTNTNSSSSTNYSHFRGI